MTYKLPICACRHGMYDAFWYETHANYCWLPVLFGMKHTLTMSGMKHTLTMSGMEHTLTMSGIKHTLTMSGIKHTLTMYTR